MNNDNEFDPFKDILNQNKVEEKKEDYFGNDINIKKESHSEVNKTHKYLAIGISLVIFVGLVFLIFYVIRRIYG